MITKNVREFVMQLRGGDVVCRKGLQQGLPLASILLGEEYDHSGISMNMESIYHIEGNGYETVPKENFFTPSKARSGAIIRFDGPFKEEIINQVCSLAKGNIRIGQFGNPFSSAETSYSVSCNEFVYRVFKMAIISSLRQAHDEGRTQTREGIWKAYFQNGTVRPLGDIQEHKLSKLFFVPPEITTMGMEVFASYDIKNPTEVRATFEGDYVDLCDEKTKSNWWEKTINSICNTFSFQIPRLKLYTPNTFIQSRYFNVVCRYQPSKNPSHY